MELLNNECLHRILGMSFHGTEKLENNYCIMLCLLIFFYPPFLSFYFTTQTNMGLNNWKCLYARIWICIWVYVVSKRTRTWVRCNPTKRWQKVNLKYHYVHICCIISHCWTNHHKKKDYKILTEMWNNVIHILCK